MRPKLTTILTAAGLAGLLAAPAAIAAPSGSGGRVRMFIRATSPTQGKIMMTGAIGDYGTLVSVNRQGKPDPDGDFFVAKLRQGVLRFDGTGLDRALSHARPVVSRASCSLSVSATGAVKVTGGSGSYAEARGTITATGDLALIGGRVAKGPHRGACVENDKVPPRAVFEDIIGSGSLHLG